MGDYKYNMSFEKMFMYLEKAGIKNRRFFFRIYNRDLVHVDPYDPKLSTKTKKAIVDECTMNIWYFLRNVVRIPTQGGGWEPYRLNRQNCAQVFCYTNEMDTWLTAPDNLYRTTNTICILIWDALFHGRVCTKYAPYPFTDYMYKFEQIVNHLPEYMKPEEVIGHRSNVYIDSAGEVDEGGISMSAIDLGAVHFQNAEHICGIDQLYKIKKEATNENKIIPCLFEDHVNPYYVAYVTTGAKSILNEAITWEDKFYDDMTLIESGKLVHIENNYKDFFFDDVEAEEWYRVNSKYHNLGIGGISIVRDSISEVEFKQKAIEIYSTDNPIATKFDIQYFIGG